MKEHLNKLGHKRARQIFSDSKINGIQIFIGSTFKDLKNHRTVTINALERLAVYVEAIELWFAKPEDPLTVCLEHVRKSDVYVCVVAYRYGSMTELGKSYTQCEYETARKTGKDCLVFLMSEEYPLPPKYVDTGTARAKLEEFKQTLRKNHVCAFFSSPEDLAHKVVESVRDLMKAKGVQGVAALSLDQFWKEMQSRWEELEPSHRMEFDHRTDVLELIKALQDQIEGIQGFHEHMESSYGRLESDLKLVLERIGYDPAKIEEIPYYENPFINRDWEWITLFPNRLTACRIALAQIRVKYLELLSQTSRRTKELAKTLDGAKRELENAVKSGYYID